MTAQLFVNADRDDGDRDLYYLPPDRISVMVRSGRCGICGSEMIQSQKCNSVSLICEKNSCIEFYSDQFDE